MEKHLTRVMQKGRSENKESEVQWCLVEPKGTQGPRLSGDLKLEGCEGPR